MLGFAEGGVEDNGWMVCRLMDQIEEVLSSIGETNLRRRA